MGNIGLSRDLFGQPLDNWFALDLIRNGCGWHTRTALVLWLDQIDGDDFANLHHLFSQLPFPYFANLAFTASAATDIC